MATNVVWASCCGLLGHLKGSRHLLCFEGKFCFHGCEGEDNFFELGGTVFVKFGKGGVEVIGDGCWAAAYQLDGPVGGGAVFMTAMFLIPCQAVSLCEFFCFCTELDFFWLFTPQLASEGGVRPLHSAEHSWLPVHRGYVNRMEVNQVVMRLSQVLKG